MRFLKDVLLLEKIKKSKLVSRENKKQIKKDIEVLENELSILELRLTLFKLSANEEMTAFKLILETDFHIELETTKSNYDNPKDINFFYGYKNKNYFFDDSE